MAACQAVMELSSGGRAMVTKMTERQPRKRTSTVCTSDLSLAARSWQLFRARCSCAILARSLSSSEAWGDQNSKIQNTRAVMKTKVWEGGLLA